MQKLKIDLKRNERGQLNSPFIALKRPLSDRLIWICGR